MADTTTVHFLLGGRALCGKPGVPGEWEAGHKWVRTDSDEGGPRSAANCPGCLTVRSASNREAAGVPDDERDWFFTFGPAHHYPGKPEQPLVRSFVRFRGTYMSARMQMIEVFGGKWAFQYESAQAAGVDEHGLTEVHPLVGPVAEPVTEARATRLTDDERAALVRGHHTPPSPLDFVPSDLRDAYRNDATVHAWFEIAMREGLPLERTLIVLVEALLAEKVTLTAAVLSYAKNAPPPVLRFDGPPPAWLTELRGRAPLSDVDRELLSAVLEWRAQGRKSKWTTAPSRHLAEVADRLRERYPDLCEALTSEPVEERPPCPECQQPMARYAGPGTERGWTCVRCEPNPA